MRIYNIQDTKLLEEVYLKLRPWIRSHPNIALYIDSNNPVCSHCGSRDIRQRGIYVTQVGKYKTYQCEDCGAFSRERTSTVPKDKRQSLLVSIAR